MDTKKGITASTVENVYRCRRCGEVYPRKLDALACKHEKLIDDEVNFFDKRNKRGIWCSYYC